MGKDQTTLNSLSLPPRDNRNRSRSRRRRRPRPGRRPSHGGRRPRRWGHGGGQRAGFDAASASPSSRRRKQLASPWRRRQASSPGRVPLPSPRGRGSSPPTPARAGTPLHAHASTPRRQDASTAPIRGGTPRRPPALDRADTPRRPDMRGSSLRRRLRGSSPRHGASSPRYDLQT